MPWNQHISGLSLTKVAMAVYESCQPVRDFIQGSKQISRLPDFLKVGERTRELFIRSAKTNILYYLIPAFMAPRFLMAIAKTDPHEAFPEWMQNDFDFVLLSAMILGMARLYLRRLRDNGFILAAGYPSLIT